MTENNAAQPGLTDDALMDLEKQVQRDIPRFGPNVHIGVRAGVLRAMLSKLRAEGVQAGDEREAFEAWALTEFTHPFMVPDPLIEDPDGSGDYVNRDVQMAWAGYQQARAALASAPVAGKCPPPPPPPPSLAYREIESGVVKPRPEPFMHHDDYPHNPRMFQPAPAQASAPVAGEPAEWQSAQRITELPAVDTALANFCDDGTQNNAVLLVLAILYAAPRASEAATAAAHDVLAERRRQVDAEGFKVADDDRYQEGQMSAAAAAYSIDACANVTGHASLSKPPSVWPWDPKWWKPDGARRNLVKAAALILAEIERLDRAAIAQQSQRKEA